MTDGAFAGTQLREEFIGKLLGAQWVWDDSAAHMDAKIAEASRRTARLDAIKGCSGEMKSQLAGLGILPLIT